MLAATLFPIEGLSDARFRFRVLTLRERIPEDNQRHRRLQRWTNRLWKRILRCPVYSTTSQEGEPVFLIPDEFTNRINSSGSIEIRDVPDQLYHIDLTETIIDVSIEEATGIQNELICRMLERAISDKLGALNTVFWRSEWTSFYYQNPENIDDDRDLVNAYRGVKFSVIIIENRPYLAMDVRTHYTGRISLSQHSVEEKDRILNKHLNLRLPTTERPNFIRDNGPVKYRCKFTGDTERTISEVSVEETEETVYQYYRRRYPNIDIHPEDRAVFVQDRGRDYSIPVPESRLFPVFNTDYWGVRDCSTRPQLTPKERIVKIRRFLGYLSEIRFGQYIFDISSDPFTTERLVFIPPRLEFGDNQYLNPFPDEIPPRQSREFERGITRFGTRKIVFLYKAPPYHNEVLPGIVLLFPRVIDRHTRNTFINDLRDEIRLLTRQSISVQLQRPYHIGRRERMGSSLLQLATEVKRSHPNCLALVILWNRFRKEVYYELKDAITPTRSQCAKERTIRMICNRRNPQKAKSRLRNLSLSVLTEVGVKPWVLADNLHFEFYIGIDVLYPRIYYHFIYGTGGRFVRTQTGQFVSRGKVREAIKAPELQRQLIEGIRAIVESGFPINSIAIHRDGRWWPSEQRGLEKALEHLKAHDVLSPDVRCVVVEIHKTHKPIRLFTRINQSPHFLNPLPGTYLVLDQDSVLLTTTGRPGEWDVPEGRTASTILLKIIQKIGAGETDIREVAEDAYWLSHLNWNAPDIEISLPITIRWTDEALRETFRPPIDLEEESEEIDKEQNEELMYIDEE